MFLPSRFALIAVTAAVPALWAAFPLAACAQDAPPVAAPQPTEAEIQAYFKKLRTYLSALRDAPYDAKERGPLLILVPRPLYRPENGTPMSQNRPSLSAVADAMEMRLVSAGQINVLAPRTMTVINTKPGQANPFGNLSGGESLKLLLGTFSKAQWQIAGSAAGLGINDLTDDQKPLWGQIMPEEAHVDKSTVRKSDQPNSWTYADTTSTDVHPRDTARLRLSKTINFAFYKTGAKEIGWGDDPYMNLKDGNTHYDLPGFNDKPKGTLPNSAYGVQLLTQSPVRAKTGSLDFAAPSLDKIVVFADFPINPAPEKPAPLPPSPTIGQEFERLELLAQTELATLPTIGEILANVSKVTGFEFVADARVRDLPVFLRGESARAGDVLSALALSVSGAFRKMEPGDKKDTAPLYLLTDGVEGIGTRAARLAEWGEAAASVKYRVQEKTEETAAKNEPLAFLSFAPGDAFALPKAQSERIEAAWQAQKYRTAPDTKVSDLSPALKQAVQDFASERADDGIGIDTSRVQIREILRAYLLFPEMSGQAVEAQSLSWGVQGQYLQTIAYNPDKAAPETPAKTPAKPAPLGFDSPVLAKQRRILMVRPANETEAAQIVTTAKVRGITDVWLEVTEANASLILTAGIKAGGGKIAVGGVLHLLKNGMAHGEPDKNILGETGQQLLDRLVAAGTDAHGDFNGFAGWTSPDTVDVADLHTRVTQIAQIPNLAGLCFRATGGPGWTGIREGGDALGINTDQGYTSGMRRAFVRERGIDPVDIVDTKYRLGDIDWNIGYFKASDGRGEYEVIDQKLVRRSENAVPRTAWWGFRRRKNTAWMATLWQSVRKAKPNLPLYTDDQVSSYARANTDWFGSWDKAGELPNFGPYVVESEVQAQARRTSKEIFVHWGHWWDNERAAKPDAPATFVRDVSAAARRFPPPAWNGIVMDLTHVSAAKAVQLLEALPQGATPTKK